MSFAVPLSAQKGLLLYLVMSLEDVYEAEVEVCASPRTSVSIVACVLPGQLFMCCAMSSNTNIAGDGTGIWREQAVAWAETAVLACYLEVSAKHAA